MLISVNFSPLNKTKWYQYAVRFALGGLITAVAGLIAKKYGPNFGGLFLAFPAIFPASATLIEKHERERKAQKGLNGVRTARKAVSADATGAAIGSVALIVFACFVWKTLAHLGTVQTLLYATLLWLAASVLIWLIRKRHVSRRIFQAIATDRVATDAFVRPAKHALSPAEGAKPSGSVPMTDIKSRHRPH